MLQQAREGQRWENKGREHQHTEDRLRSNKSRFAPFALCWRDDKPGAFWIYLFRFSLITSSAFPIIRAVECKLFNVSTSEKGNRRFFFLFEPFPGLSRVGQSCLAAQSQGCVHESWSCFVNRRLNFDSPPVVNSTKLSLSRTIYYNLAPVSKFQKFGLSVMSS